MPRLEPLKREDLPDYEPMFQMVEAGMGFVPNSLLTMARWPELIQAASGLFATINVAGVVDPQLKMLLSYAVSRSAGCSYCQAHTSHGAVEKAGIAAEKLEAIWSYETSDLFSDGERAAIAVAQGAGQVPNAVTDEEFEELKKHFSEREIVEIVALIAMFGFLNRWNDTMATTLETSPLRFSEKALAGDDWSVGKHGGDG